MNSFVERLLYSTENINHVARRYMQVIGLRVDMESLGNEIEGHPNYPSLLALNDAFCSFGAKTVAARVDRAELAKLDRPYITQIRPKGESVTVFTVVRPDSADLLSYLDPHRSRWISSTINEFADMSNGVVLVATADSESQEAVYPVNRKSNNWFPALPVGLLTVLFAPVVTSITLNLLTYGFGYIFTGIYLFLATIGVVICSILLWSDLDRHNPALKSVCAGNGKINCEAIITSSASKVFGISWSLIGFAYFTGIVVTMLAIEPGNLFLPRLLSWLSLSALGYTGYSLYYQWRIAKQWCILCLSVQAILVAQNVVCVVAGWPFLSADKLPYREVATLLVSFSLPFFGGGVAVAALKQAKEGKKYRNELNRLKRNPEIFRTLLANRKAAIDTEGLGITLGKPGARHRIIKVCNPYCGPCAQAHPLIDEILNDCPDVQVRIIFAADNSKNDRKAPPVKHLMAVAEQGDEPQLRQVLDEWYNAPSKDYGLFSRKFPIDSEKLDKQGHRLLAMKAWCEQMDIIATPTFFIDGHQLPEMYTLSDLKYLLKI